MDGSPVRPATVLIRVVGGRNDNRAFQERPGTPDSAGRFHFGRPRGLFLFGMGTVLAPAVSLTEAKPTGSPANDLRLPGKGTKSIC